MVEEGPEGGNDDEGRVEEIVDLRTCRPKPNGRSLVWTRRLFLLDPQKRAVCTCCEVPVPCPISNTTNLTAHYESPSNVDDDHKTKLDAARKQANKVSHQHRS